MSNRLEYKGYHTNIEIDFEANQFYGEIDFCQAVGKQPQQPIAEALEA